MSEGLRSGLRLRLRRAEQRTREQHTRLRALLRDAEAAVRTGEPHEERLRSLRDALAAHFELEESIAFPALHGLEPASGSELEELCSDHHAFLDELAKLADGAPDAARRVLALGRALREHESREERTMARLLARGAGRHGTGL
jgi:hypothetical protein